jgi:hypothetical protein
MSDRRNALHDLPPYEEGAGSQGVKKAEKKSKEVLDKPKKDSTVKQKIPAEKETKVPKKESSTKYKTDNIVAVEKSKKDVVKKKKHVPVPEILTDAVMKLLYLELKGAMNDQFRKFTLDAVFKDGKGKPSKAVLTLEGVMREQKSVYKNFMNFCLSKHTHNEFMCFSLLVEMMDSQTDDYDKFVNSFNKAWVTYYDPKQVAAPVDCLRPDMVAGLHSVFWDTTTNMPKPLSEDLISKATEIFGNMSSAKALADLQLLAVED